MVRAPSATSAGIAVLAALLSTMADYTVTSTVDPTPGQPNSGDEITATFTGADTPEGRADADALKAAFDMAVAGSADMKAKVIAAGNRHGRNLKYKAVRKDPKVAVASTNNGEGTVTVDFEDLSALRGKLSTTDATDAEINRLVDNFLKELLAHETEHLKHDGDGDPGNDASRNPPNGPTTGPQVDDENTVLDELGVKIYRKQYGYKGADGKKKVDFIVTVDGGPIPTTHTITLDMSGFLDAATKLFKAFPATPFNVSPSLLQSIPGGVCTGQGGEPPCYPSTCGGTTPDADCDGVPAFEDNCPSVANPTRADMDGDGVGDPCDNCCHTANPDQADDDQDGLGNACEFITVPMVVPAVSPVGFIAYPIIALVTLVIVMRRLRTS